MGRSEGVRSRKIRGARIETIILGKKKGTFRVLQNKSKRRLFRNIFVRNNSNNRLNEGNEVFSAYQLPRIKDLSIEHDVENRIRKNRSVATAVS